MDLETKFALLDAALTALRALESAPLGETAAADVAATIVSLYVERERCGEALDADCPDEPNGEAAGWEAAA